MLGTKHILLIILLTITSLGRTEEAPPSTAPFTAIIVLPDTFSEEDPQKLTAQSEGVYSNSNQQTAAFEALEKDWQALRAEIISDSTIGVSGSPRFEDLFSVVVYDFATVIQLKTPRIETILERKILAQRYLARLSLLAQRWPAPFSRIILAGVGRGADVGRAMMERSASNNPLLKNIQGLVSVGDPKRLIKLMGIFQDGNQAVKNSNQNPQQSLREALNSLDSNMHILTKGLANLRNGLKPGEKLDQKRIAKIYTYYMLTILGFMEELAKMQSVHAVHNAMKAASLSSNIVHEPEFNGKLSNFMQIWMDEPDDDITFFLIRELISPSMAQKISDLSDLFSEGKIYQELPIVGRIYFHAIKDAIKSATAQNASDPSHLLNNLLNNFDNHITTLGATISEIHKGLIDMGQSTNSKEVSALHVEFEHPNDPKLDKNLFIKIKNTVSDSANTAGMAGL